MWLHTWLSLLLLPQLSLCAFQTFHVQAFFGPVVHGSPACTLRKASLLQEVTCSEWIAYMQERSGTLWLQLVQDRGCLAAAPTEEISNRSLLVGRQPLPPPPA